MFSGFLNSPQSEDARRTWKVKKTEFQSSFISQKIYKVKKSTNRQKVAENESKNVAPLDVTVFSVSIISSRIKDFKLEY